MSIASTQTLGSNCGRVVGKQLVAFYEEAKKPGKLQEGVTTVARGAIGAAAVATSPVSFVMGTAAAVVAPEPTRKVVRLADAGLTAVWNKMSFNQKIVAAGGAVVVAWAMPTLIALPAAVLAVKMGAEYTLRNRE